jgi:hypothetical protein
MGLTYGNSASTELGVEKSKLDNSSNAYCEPDTGVHSSKYLKFTRKGSTLVASSRGGRILGR